MIYLSNKWGTHKNATELENSYRKHAGDKTELQCNRVSVWYNMYPKKSMKTNLSDKKYKMIYSGKIGS